MFQIVRLMLNDSGDIIARRPLLPLFELVFKFPINVTVPTGGTAGAAHFSVIVASPNPAQAKARRYPTPAGIVSIDSVPDGRPPRNAVAREECTMDADGSPSDSKSAVMEATHMGDADRTPAASRNAERSAADAAANPGAEATAVGASASSAVASTAAAAAMASTAAAMASTTAASMTGPQRRSRDQCSADHGRCYERRQFFVSHAVFSSETSPPVALL
jgi:hypothetical protein